jgi:glycerophosphoryl diester phosphodiesterase
MKIFFLSLCCLLAAMGGFAQSPPNFEPEQFHKLRFAHRGGYANGPENTIETITLNIREKGVKAVEVDVRQTLDGHLVLFHDDRIGRILQSDQDKEVAQMTWAELKAIPLRDTRFGEVFVTDFNTLMDTVRHLAIEEGRDFLVELDFKPGGDQTEEAVRKMLDAIYAQTQVVGEDMYKYFFVSTFYPEVLSSVRSYSQDFKLGFAVNSDPNESKFLARLAILLSPIIAKKYKVDIIEPNHCMVTKSYVRRWKRRGLAMNAYTANSSCEKAMLEELGIAYTTNCPTSDCEDDPSDQVGVKRGWCKDCKKEK